jgi:hypothetical protein
MLWTIWRLMWLCSHMMIMTGLWSSCTRWIVRVGRKGWGHFGVRLIWDPCNLCRRK